jgi:acyl carrier protein
MTSVAARVANCFQNVFPELEPADITEATIESVDRWDSLAHVTLLVVLSEEFALEFSVDQFTELTSFPAIVAHIKTRVRD